MKKHYSGRGGEPPEVPKRLPPSTYAETVRPDRYLASDELVDAVNVAILLGQPLLLTGEPGTGKTQLANSVAWELGYGEKALRFQVRSTSKARDLFYTYDAIGRFEAIQTGSAVREAREYVSYQALGKAILHSHERQAVRELLPESFQHPGRRASVVLIDEIDKAPRDFPNDILAELEELSFEVRELGSRPVAADPELRPFVVITSNSEKQLPDAFLRRCVYFNIPFPEGEQLKRIVAARVGAAAAAGSDFLRDALDLLNELRSDAGGLRKKPATAELLSWILALRGQDPSAANPIAADPEAVRRTLIVLVKTREDQERAGELLDAWLKKRAR